MQHITTMLSNTGLSELCLHKIKNQLSSNSKITTHDIYFISSKQTLSIAELNILKNLLDSQRTSNLILDTQNIIVTPRLGTVSPWSSKATEIAKRCGLDNITRIEKGLYFQAQSSLISSYNLIHDKMTQSIISNNTDIEKIFTHKNGTSYKEIDIKSHGKKHLEKINISMGLALSVDEIDYLYNHYTAMNSNPTDVELMMFAQANSEHCRHKIFNANFIINNIPQQNTLFSMIKDTYKNAPQNVLIAYSDNSSVIAGDTFTRIYPNYQTKQYEFKQEKTHVLMKVETHNHPTAISPYEGAATGSGGEIRDEGATGRGAKPKAGLTGFSVSNLKFDDEYTIKHKPNHIKSPLEIMLDAPIGGASFNNEFGRPNLCGYFRSFEQQVGNVNYGYHKPIMIAGGYGNINADNVEKQEVLDNALIIQLGGPGFLIGLGGGSASSMVGGENLTELDFNSVQRSNPEIERRCQEVIDTCSYLGKNNPILSIHDVGAGGLSNAVPELVHGSEKGGFFELRQIPIYEIGMSPLETWCNESQERYVLAILPQNLELFTEICNRENCPFAVIGYATKDKHLILNDTLYNNKPINMPMDVLLGAPPQTTKDVSYNEEQEQRLPHHESVMHDSFMIRNDNTLNGNIKILTNAVLAEAVHKVISHPTVASKAFLITIGDRSVGGHTVRDQMIGKWQTPVADCAITAFSYYANGGEVISMGERSPVAILNAPASGRLAIAESLTNIASCYIKDINDIKLSANWMASCGSDNQDALLYKTVEAVSKLSQQLNIAIPVGKDSLSMKMQWQNQQNSNSIISPVSLIITAFATTPDTTKHVTPELINKSNSILILISLNNKCRLGGSILQECYNSISGPTPDIDDATSLNNLFTLIQELHLTNMILAYHDKSDGGLIATLSEMIFASHLGIELNLNLTDIDLNQFLFNEEIGVVIQIDNANINIISTLVTKYNLHLSKLGTVKTGAVKTGTVKTERINREHDNFVIKNNGHIVFNEPRIKLHQAWSETSYKIQRLRDNPNCADSEYNTLSDIKNTGLFAKLSFDINTPQPPSIHTAKPRIAILREQGVNGHLEMAAAFSMAGFDAFDVHINDILSGRVPLANFVGIVACGGFSYGDVLGAGSGWAKSILFNPKLKDEFSAFFNRNNTFALGVCNGCQMLSQLAEIIPGSSNFPTLKRNISEQFEARLSMVEITPSPSILFKDMIGSQLPIVVSHGEGYTKFKNNQALNSAHIAMRYIDYQGKATEIYPYNPNGSPQGITAVTNDDGRFTIMMPHPERIFRTRQMSWHNKTWGEMSPWFKVFLNAYDFVK